MNKKIYMLVCLLAVFSLQAMGQAKKPKLMLVPSDNWCITRGYTKTIDNQGTTVVYPDYKRALQNDADLGNVITRFGILMTDRGFNLVDLESTLEIIERRAAEDNLITSKTSGASLAESPLDQFRRRANSDIELQINWQVHTTGPKRSITYNLRGVDAYSGVQAAAAQGTCAPSISTELPVLLEEAVSVHIDRFASQLMGHFEELLEKGREVVVITKVFEGGADMDFETEYDGVELAEIIENWISDNTVNHSYTKSDGTENYMLFDQVRIPLFRPNGSGMSTENFVRDLRNFLRKPPYNIPSKVLTRGLGECVLIIGEK